MFPCVGFGRREARSFGLADFAPPHPRPLLPAFPDSAFSAPLQLHFAENVQKSAVLAVLWPATLGPMFTGVFKERASAPATKFAAHDALARILRSRRLHAHAFTRRAEIGPFVVDYVCREQALVVELLSPNTVAKQQARVALLMELGYRVLQITTRELAHPERVLATIEAALRS